MLIGAQQVTRLLQRQHGSTALLSEVISVSVGCAQVVSQLDAGSPHRVLLELPGAADDNVHLDRTNAGFSQGLLRRPGAHPRGLIRRTGPGCAAASPRLPHPTPPQSPGSA